MVMPALFLMKYKVARVLHSHRLLADAKQTFTCCVLSLALLTGLYMNYRYGFWPADPMVGLVIVFYLFKEGYETWREGRRSKKGEK
jgi:divalent metal cation (Fe/Co/Zn/Cd) transporter